tara:strand:- start:126 stop:380 length:255 start_codon:yes stop_codon:yes gene_type:complete
MLKITLTKQAAKALQKMQPKQARRIRDAIELIANDPARQDLDIKKMVNTDTMRLRIGDYRVIYREDGCVLAVIRVGARGDVYKA